jgi:hypothetical protein
MAMFKMAHDVFISHAHKDIEIAKAICRKLELARIGCWIAQRDILAGDDWTVATRKAISSSRVLLVLLSENANAATHIEREIAQAFYSKLSILPVRLSEAPLKRDFLFYLSDVRCFEASKLPEEQFLGPLVTSVKSMVQDNALASNALPGRPLPAHRNLTGFSDSWQGALQASHYRTLDIVKKVSVTVVILSAAWVFWYLYSSGKNDGPPADDGQHATGPAFVPSLDPTPRAAAEASPSKPEYTYSRFGLWVASKSTPTPVAQIGGPAAQSTPTVSDSELSGTPNKVEREASAETANPVSNEGGEAKPAQEKTSDPTDRDEPATPAIHSSSTEKDELAESDASTGVAPQALHTPATPNSPVQPGASADSKPSVEAVESILAAKPVPVAESTPSVESTPVSEPTPVAEASPSADPQPSVESTPTAESTAVAEASPSADPQPPLESTPTAESTAVAEATPFAETRPLSESAPAENTARPPDTGPLARSILAAQSTPPAELTAAVKSGEKSEAEVDDGSKPSSEGQSLKELVLDYLRTVAGDDNFAQEHLFGWRVNFYGKGLLPIAGVRASMDRYREEWPVRDWEPEGEPEFPGDLHAIHPELFEVLQPFSWKVANGSRRKTGRATLYVRIRRDEKGSFHIIHLELRHPDENSAR